jgi:hypothetical protein
MSNQAQRNDDAKAVSDAISLACGDNAAASAYLTMIAQVARMIDDLEDGDTGPVDIGYLAHLVLVALPRNPFFAQHAAYLVPLHDAAINAWQDANQMDPDGHLPAVRIWSDQINEIACVVAGLAGGYHHRRNVSPRIRMLLHPDWDDASADSEPEKNGRAAETPTHHSSLITHH